MRELNLTPLDLFRLVSMVNTLPSEWRDLLKRSSHSGERTFNLQDHIVLSLSGQKTPINKAVSKTIYKELRNRVSSTPPAQKKYNSCFVNDTLDWSEIYSLPHRVTSDTKLREFQFKLLKRYLATSDFLNKIGVLPSPACSLCGTYLNLLFYFIFFLQFFISCHYSKTLLTI